MSERQRSRTASEAIQYLAAEGKISLENSKENNPWLPEPIGKTVGDQPQNEVMAAPGTTREKLDQIYSMMDAGKFGDGLEDYSLNDLDKLRADAYGQCGQDSAQFHMYNMAYVKKHSDSLKKNQENGVIALGYEDGSEPKREILPVSAGTEKAVTAITQSELNPKADAVQPEPNPGVKPETASYKIDLKTVFREKEKGKVIDFDNLDPSEVVDGGGDVEFRQSRSQLRRSERDNNRETENSRETLSQKFKRFGKAVIDKAKKLFGSKKRTLTATGFTTTAGIAVASAIMATNVESTTVEQPSVTSYNPQVENVANINNLKQETHGEKPSVFGEWLDQAMKQKAAKRQEQRMEDGGFTKEQMDAGYSVDKDISYNREGLTLENDFAWGHNLNADGAITAERAAEYAKNKVSTSVDQMIGVMSHMNVIKSSETGGKMTIEEMRAYADKLKSNPAKATEFRNKFQEVMSKSEFAIGNKIDYKFNSLYLADLDLNGDMDIGVAKDLEIGGTEIIVTFDGMRYVFRAECGFQPIGPEENYEEINQTPPTEKETPPTEKETPPKTPPVIPPYTPPYTPPIAPPPGVPEDFKFNTDQTIYNYGGSVMQAERGELTEELTPEEEKNQATFDIAHMLGDDKVEAEGNNSDISHESTTENPVVSDGDITPEAQAQIDENQRGVEAENQTEYRYEADMDSPIQYGGETLTAEQIIEAQKQWATQNQSNGSNNP